MQHMQEPTYEDHPQPEPYQLSPTKGEKHPTSPSPMRISPEKSNSSGGRNKQLILNTERKYEFTSSNSGGSNKQSRRSDQQSIVSDFNPQSSAKRFVLNKLDF